MYVLTREYVRREHSEALTKKKEIQNKKEKKRK